MVAASLGVWALAGHRFSVNKPTGRKIAETGLRTALHIAHTPPGRVIVFAARRRVWSEKEASWAGVGSQPRKAGLVIHLAARSPHGLCDAEDARSLPGKPSDFLRHGPQVLSWPLRTRHPLPSSARYSKRLGDEKRLRGEGSCGVKIEGVLRRVLPVPPPTHPS